MGRSDIVRQPLLTQSTNSLSPTRLMDNPMSDHRLAIVSHSRATALSGK